MAVVAEGEGGATCPLLDTPLIRLFAINEASCVKNPELEEWEAFKKEIAVEMAVSQDLQVNLIDLVHFLWSWKWATDGAKLYF